MIRAILILLIFTVPAFATWKDSPLHKWFEKLESKKGMCCSFADGMTVEDPDWGTEGSHYWVIIEGTKLTVPSEALVTVPNRFGRPVVWPIVNGDGSIEIRCFMPGAGL